MTIYADIKKEQLDNYDEIVNSANPEELIMEYAESWVPVYYHLILEAWKEMPSIFNDSWKETGDQYGQGIFDLMIIDISTWYRDIAIESWQEIKKLKEEESTNE